MSEEVNKAMDGEAAFFPRTLLNLGTIALLSDYLIMLFNFDMITQYCMYLKFV